MMKAAFVICLAAVATARPLSLRRREVPQEHSHEKFLTSVASSLATNNPDNIVDPVFGLLGDAVCLNYYLGLFPERR